MQVIAQAQAIAHVSRQYLISFHINSFFTFVRLYYDIFLLFRKTAFMLVTNRPTESIEESHLIDIKNVKVD